MMIASRKNLSLLFAILSLRLLKTLAENDSDLAYTQLNSKTECDKNALFPVPPCCGVPNLNSGRIFGGEKAQPNEFPWMVPVCMENNIGCGGGSLINSRWVLTAAHNVVDENGKIMEIRDVRLGIMNIKADSLSEPQMKIVQVDKVIPHELYHLENVVPEHDIALLHLTEPVTFTDAIKPICLPLNEPKIDAYANKTAIVAGWGLTEKNDSSDILLKASLRVWDSQSCKPHADNVVNVVCAGGVKGIDACTGDSGGPLMLQVKNAAYKPFYQIGLVSFGKGCGKEGFPTIYSYIPAYVKWINDTMSKFH